MARCHSRKSSQFAQMFAQRTALKSRKLCQVQSVVLQNLQIFGASGGRDKIVHNKRYRQNVESRYPPAQMGKAPDECLVVAGFFALWLDALCIALTPLATRGGVAGGCALTYGLQQQQHRRTWAWRSCISSMKCVPPLIAVAQRMVALYRSGQWRRDLFRSTPTWPTPSLSKWWLRARCRSATRKSKPPVSPRWAPQADLPAMELRCRSQAGKRGQGGALEPHPMLARKTITLSSFGGPTRAINSLGLTSARSAEHFGLHVVSRASGHAVALATLRTVKEQQQRVGFAVVPVVVEIGGALPRASSLRRAASGARGGMLTPWRRRCYFRRLQVRLE